MSRWRQSIGRVSPVREVLVLSVGRGLLSVGRGLPSVGRGLLSVGRSPLSGGIPRGPRRGCDRGRLSWRGAGAGSSGMTLIEVLVVLMIISITISVMAVAVGSVFGTRLVTASGKLMATIRYTYDRAIMEGKAHQLVIDLDENQYWIEEIDPTNRCKKRLSDLVALDKGASGEADGTQEDEEVKGKKVEDMIIKTQKLPKGIVFDGAMAGHDTERLTSGKARILFFPDGTAEKGLVWLARDEDMFTVEVKALQGRGVLHREDLDPGYLEKK